MLEIQHKPGEKLVKPKVIVRERLCLYFPRRQSLMTDDKEMPYFIQITPANPLLSHKTPRIASEHFNQEERMDGNHFDNGYLIITRKVIQLQKI